MEVGNIKDWKRVLFILPVLNHTEQEKFRELLLEMKEMNSGLQLETIVWEPDKRKAGAKNHVRLPNEMNGKDFSLFGKLKNEHLKHYFSGDFEVLVVFPFEFPEKVRKLFKKTENGLKIGFTPKEDFYSAVFSDSSNQFSEKVRLFRKYVLRR